MEPGLPGAFEARERPSPTTNRCTSATRAQPLMRDARTGPRVATIGVKQHAFVGAALLAFAAIVAAVGPFLGTRRDLVFLPAMAGFTLFAQAMVFWSFPSFAKRELVLDGFASYAGPTLLPVALVGSLVNAPSIRDPTLGLALAFFGLIPLASAWWGKPWRSGVPFWRTASAFRQGDLAAMLALAAGSAWLVLAGLAGMFAPRAVVILWPVGLALVALGALAHLVPRARGRAPWTTLFTTGVAAGQAGALYLLWAPAFAPDASTLAARVLLAGFPLAALALTPPRPTKLGGIRWRDARVLHTASVVGYATAAVALVLGIGTLGYLAFVAGAGLGLAALGMLTMPVAFNQRPASAFVLPTAVAALAGLAGIGVGRTGVGMLFFAAALVAWLAVVAPLRRPRRAC